MSDDAVAQVYANALLDLAFTKGVPGEVLRDLEQVARVLEADRRRVLSFFVAPSIKRDVKKQIIEKAFGNAVAEVVVNFLKVIIDKGRASDLPAILKTFVELYHERQGELVVHVTAAQQLGDDERERLKRALKKKNKGYSEFILKERVDPSLLGGLVVRTGDSVYDASLRSRLEVIGERLKSSRVNNEVAYED